MTNENDLPLVILAHPLPGDWLSPLKGKCRLITGDAGISGFSPRLKQAFPEASGIISLLVDPIRAADLDAAPNLKVISNYAAGLDNIDLNECTRRRIPVGHTPGILTAATADLTMALLLAAARGLFPAATDAREGRWKSWTPDGWLGHDLQEACLGIVGMGQIGSAVARRASGFGMRIVYSAPVRNREVEQSTGASHVPLDELLAVSDFISLHVPLTPETHRMINQKSIGLMKTGAILVNAARGAIVDMDVLAGALESGKLACAALDVTDPEPLPPGHRLYSLPNCIIVPHIGSATNGTRREMAALACRNLLAGLEDKELPMCANPEVYR